MRNPANLKQINNLERVCSELRNEPGSMRCVLVSLTFRHP